LSPLFCRSLLSLFLSHALRIFHSDFRSRGPSRRLPNFRVDLFSAEIRAARRGKSNASRERISIASREDRASSAFVAAPDDLESVAAKASASRRLAERRRWRASRVAYLSRPSLSQRASRIPPGMHTGCPPRNVFLASCQDSTSLPRGAGRRSNESLRLFVRPRASGDFTCKVR